MGEEIRLILQDYNPEITHDSLGTNGPKVRQLILSNQETWVKEICDRKLTYPNGHGNRNNNTLRQGCWAGNDNNDGVPDPRNPLKRDQADGLCRAQIKGKLSKIIEELI